MVVVCINTTWNMLVLVVVVDDAFATIIDRPPQKSSRLRFFALFLLPLVLEMGMTVRRIYVEILRDSTQIVSSTAIFLAL